MALGVGLGEAVPDEVGVGDDVGVGLVDPLGDGLGSALRAALGDADALGAGEGASALVGGAGSGAPPGGDAVRRAAREARSGPTGRCAVGSGPGPRVVCDTSGVGAAHGDTSEVPSTRDVARTPDARTADAPTASARGPRRRGALCLPIRGVSQRGPRGRKRQHRMVPGPAPTRGSMGG